MAQLPIVYGTTPNDGTGTNWRTAWQRTQDNFTDLYSRVSHIVSAGEERFSVGATTEARIALADAAAVAELANILFIPAFMLPYDIALCPASANVRRVREGGDFSVYDVQAYGADATGVLDAGPMWNACRANVPAAGGQMRVSNGAYKLTTAFTFAAQQNITVFIDAGVSLTGNALPAVRGSSPFSPDFNAYVDYRAGVLSITNRIQFPTNASPNAPTIVDHIEPTFNGTIDPVIFIGYNMTGGTLVVAGEPGAAWAVEGNYNDGSGQNKMEAYIQFLATDDSYQRPFFATYNRVTKKGMPFISGDAISMVRGIVAGVFGDSMIDYNNDGVNGNYQTMHPCLYVAPTVLEITAAAGSYAGVSFGITGTTAASLVAPVANKVALRVGGRTDSFNLYAMPLASAGDSMAVGANDDGAVGTFNNTGLDGLKGVVARAKATQTGNLFEAQDSLTAPLWAVDAVGTMIAVAATTAKPSIRLPHGAAPSAPTNGDMWTTTAGLYVRINGATVGPLS